MNEHKQFEIICALVVVGQASDADLRDLKPHIEGCVDCQNRISDFAQISAQALPLSGEKYSKPRSPNAMTARFVERARAGGIPLRESEPMVPSHLSFGSLSWKGNLAAALLLIAIIAGGISKSVHSRAQSADKAAKLELANQQSIQTKITQTRTTPQRTKLLPVPRQMRMSNARYSESAHTPRRPNSEQDSGFLGPEQVLPGPQFSANYYQGEPAFNSLLFSSDVKSEHPRLFQAYDGSSDRPWLAAPSFKPFTERTQLVNGADYAGTDPRGRSATFAVMSLNLPLHIFGFGSDRTLISGSPRTQSELNPSIDWYQVWLKMRVESLRNSTDPPQYHPGVLAPAWPFSNASKGDQQ
jgi:hypothetical protein